MSRLIAILILMASLFAVGSARAADISQVMAEYKANSSGFWATYSGRTISVTGTVSAVYASYVALGDARLFVVDCFANPGQIGGLSPGRQVTATGTLSSMLTGNGIELRPCSLQ